MQNPYILVALALIHIFLSVVLKELSIIMHSDDHAWTAFFQLVVAGIHVLHALDIVFVFTPWMKAYKRRP